MLFKLFLNFTLFILIASKCFCEEKKCISYEKNIRFYYLNGVNNDKKEAIRTKEKLEEKTKKTITLLYNVSEKEENIRNKLFFTFPFDDFRESYEQKKAEVYRTISSKSKAMVEDLFQEIDPNTHNLIIAHSQGNLFANEICILNKSIEKSKKIEVFGVATPASYVGCGTKYITYKEDRVINSIRKDNDTIQNPLPANRSTDSCGLFSLCHNLVDTYLNLEPTSSDILNGIKEFEATALKEMDFNLTPIEILSSKEEPDFLEKTVESIVSFQNRIELIYRKQKAKMITYKFAWDLWDNISLWRIMTFSFDESDIRKIASVPINVSSNQEYADVAGYGAELYDYFCKLDQKNSKNNHYCEKVKDFNYFTLSPLMGKENLSQLNLTLKSKSLYFKPENPLKLNVNCLDIQDKKLPIETLVQLNYKPQKNKSAKIMINEFNFKIFPKNLINNEEESSDVIYVYFYEENDEIKVKYTPIKEEINYTNPEDIESAYLECDTLGKMSSKRCENYFDQIMSSKK